MDRLTSAGCTFDFFQAVWLLERFLGGRVPVGQRGPVEHELLRFRPDVSLGFPSTDVRRITKLRSHQGDAPTYRIEVSFLGLYGVSTPLPLHYAIDILRAVGQAAVPTEEKVDHDATIGPPETEPMIGSTPVRDFLDIFHHRLISLFYRSWLKYRYDRSFGMPGRDSITDYLVWLIGAGPALEQEDLGVEPLRLVRYAGLLTQRPHSAAGLEGTLLDYWKDLGVEVQPCVGRWVPVPTADQNEIGVANSRLGVDLTVGEALYDMSGTFSVVLGPMSWNEYISFLPDGTRFHQTRSLVRYYCVDPLAFTFELRIRANEIPETQLTSDGQAGRLGYTSWIRTGEKGETSVTFDACRSAGPLPEPLDDAARGQAA
jgi:type VI secretion system protein ImpH